MSIVSSKPGDEALIDFIKHEVEKAWHSGSPQYPFSLSDAIELFFELLHHRVDADRLDGVGDELLQCLRAYETDSDLRSLPVKVEPFLRFIHHLLHPPTSGAKATIRGENKEGLPAWLKRLGLADDATLRAASIAELEQRPRFAAHVGRLVVKRIDEAHFSSNLSRKEAAEVFESICVVLIFVVSEYRARLQLALLAARHRAFLEGYRDKFNKRSGLFVDLEGQEQLTDEFADIDALAVEVCDDEATADDSDEEDDESDTEPVEESPADQQRRGLVSKLVQDLPQFALLGEPGAGKTTTLEHLAWRAADSLLDGYADGSWFPVFVPLKALQFGASSPIETAIQSEMRDVTVTIAHLVRQPCLFLLDGLNEVPQEHSLAAKREIRRLLAYWQAPIC